MTKWAEFKTGLLTHFIWDALKVVLAGFVLPIIYVYLAPLLPSEVPKITPERMSLVLTIVVVLVIIVGETWSWGRKRFAVLKNTKVFYFNANASLEDTTRNTDFLLEQCRKAKDILILGATGFRTYAQKNAAGKAILRDVLEDAQGEIKILLLHPEGHHTRQRANSLSEPFFKYQTEIIDSLSFLSDLKKREKNITVKFYDQRPIWKMIILDDFLWLQYYKSGAHVHTMPVYGVSRAVKQGEYSLFDPLYAVFQKKWFSDGNPYYDFDSAQIVHDDGRKESLPDVSR